jgi:hypothetical protein
MDNIETTDWRPISTAPMDGSRILVSNGKYIEIASWSNATVWDNEGDDFFHWVVYEVKDDCYYSYHLLDYNIPIYWKPLTNLPTTKMEYNG